jgi:dephospho-CoA kinase
MGDQKRVLLGGGIGSGKTSAASILGRLGAAVLSADEAARRVLEEGGPAAAAVLARWPETGSGGRVDRPALARVVFSDPKARAELEALTHPSVWRLLLAEVASEAAPVVVIEVPLLVEPPGAGWMWVVVDAPDEVRAARLRSRGMDPADISRRMSSQVSRKEWLAVAGVVIDNGSDRAHLLTECRRAWSEIVGRQAVAWQ